MVIRRLSIIFVLLLLLVPVILAHEDDLSDSAKTFQNVYDTIKDTSVWLAVIGVLVIVLVSVLAVILEKHMNRSKLFVFLFIAGVVVIVTAFISVSTIVVNLVSETKGPVHWHADFEFYKCDEWIDLEDPTGLSNRIGSARFHEHNDNRIHVEGVVLHEDEVDLSSFFDIIGGSLTESSFSLPTTSGLLTVDNSETCDGVPSEVQVFVYQTRSGLVIPKKLTPEEFVDYDIYPHQEVPPGDCIIVEFGPPKERTDNICETYRLAIEDGDLKRGS